MTTATEGAVLLSGLTDSGDEPLTAPLGDEEYARLIRRTGLAGGEPGTTVSAFNSSVSAFSSSI